jgi:beta-N-acetylhexosaminidase
VRRLVATKKPLAVVAFGSPYMIRQFEDAPAYMVTYAIEEIAQAAAVRAVFGETNVAGRLPVTIPGLFGLGSGLKLEARR